MTARGDALRTVTSARPLRLDDGGELVVRGARGWDADAVIALLAADGPPGQSRPTARLLRRVLATEPAMVAFTREGELVAVGDLRRTGAGRGDVGVCVDPRLSGRGVASALAARLAEVATLTGCRTVRTAVLPVGSWAARIQSAYAVAQPLGA